jgi:hypothetical protein
VLAAVLGCFAVAAMGAQRVAATLRSADRQMGSQRASYGLWRLARAFARPLWPNFAASLAEPGDLRWLLVGNERPRRRVG